MRVSWDVKSIHNTHHCVNLNIGDKNFIIQSMSKNYTYLQFNCCNDAKKCDESECKMKVKCDEWQGDQVGR